MHLILQSTLNLVLDDQQRAMPPVHLKLPHCSEELMGGTRGVKSKIAYHWMTEERTNPIELMTFTSLRCATGGCYML